MNEGSSFVVGKYVGEVLCLDSLLSGLVLVSLSDLVRVEQRRQHRVHHLELASSSVPLLVPIRTYDVM